MNIQFCFDPFAVVTYICDYLMINDDGMTKLFQEALKDNVELNYKEKQNLLKTIYLTHRQVGTSEALYLLVPSMHLQGSNITTCFVATGFPEHRSYFLSKIPERNNDEDIQNQVEEGNIDYDLAECQETEAFEGEENTTLKQDQAVEILTIEGREGKSQRSILIHEKYQARPKSLEKMCLEQFAISYRPGKFKKKMEFEDDCSVKKGNLKLIDDDKELPLHIHLKPSRL